MQKILVTQNLSIGYFNKNNSNIIATDINLELGKGKLIALIGANGIGKSTLLKSLTGIIKPISGTVFLNGNDIHKMKNIEIAQNLSIVLTEKLPQSNLTVFEIVALGRQPYTNWVGKLSDTDLEKINWAIQMTEIEHLKNKKHFEISDGQLQKVLIAKSLSQDTPLIILDEPTTHLDLLQKVSLFKLLKKLTVETQKTILFSTHDIDLAIQIADEMIVFTEGEIVQNNTKKIIEYGILNTLFKEEIIFDAINRKFVINPNL